jgi:hypothetical protein
MQVLNAAASGIWNSRDASANWNQVKWRENQAFNPFNFLCNYKLLLHCWSCGSHSGSCVGTSLIIVVSHF